MGVAAKTRKNNESSLGPRLTGGGKKERGVLKRPHPILDLRELLAALRAMQGATSRAHAEVAGSEWRAKICDYVQ